MKLAMSNERLLEAADLLENLSTRRKNFKLPIQGETKYGDKTTSGPNEIPRKFSIHDWVDESFSDAGACSTAACAVGFCMFDPWFQRRGLKAYETTPLFKGESGIDAAREFFGISHYQAKDFFLAGSYSACHPTAKMVAKKIRKFVADRKGGE